MTKPGISLERHAEIGAELAAIADRLVKLSTEIGNAYPRNSRVVRMAETFSGGGRSNYLLLRSELEDEMFRQHLPPDHSEWDGYPPGCSDDVYWPPREARASPAMTA